VFKKSAWQYKLAMEVRQSYIGNKYYKTYSPIWQDKRNCIYWVVVCPKFIYITDETTIVHTVHCYNIYEQNFN